MSHLTHVLRRAEVGPEMGHYVKQLNGRGELAAVTPHLKDALRLTRAAAQDFQRDTAGWFCAVPILELIRKPRVWGAPHRETLQ